MTTALRELIENLERLGKEATPGPWYTSGPPWFQRGIIYITPLTSAGELSTFMVSTRRHQP